MTALQVADWRRRVFSLYKSVRESSDVVAAHALWKTERDELFAHHPSSPLLPEDLASFAGLPVEPYDPAWRFELPLLDAAEPKRMDVETGTDGTVPFERIGFVDVPDVGTLDVWRLASYGGGIFVPVKDALAGKPGGTYGGGRYLIDTIKGADLGSGLAGLGDAEPESGLAGHGDTGLQLGGPETLVLDFNFAYNPSCAYDPAWACPLAQPGNRVAVEIPVGERYEGLAGH
ncbi:hypothetical protein B0I08_106125 [Glaciihabitans tibetensis]|uniref:DUF1684 domain-containing protein n=1 Tax=Glaciihabitans tibetensis TaxID=1266600 RepID=A0A2T0VBS0_9MICO|nr:DUF1684 domain-containing protein [Glaciihabitans tibetensis]PRY67518.1 hypothetical protein B0I08_106125 [Glaciihabitans tibetensis]